MRTEPANYGLREYSSTTYPAGDRHRLPVLFTARDGGKRVVVSRAITDFAYCCYLSDLAVDRVYQNQAIGQRLVEETQQAAGEEAMLMLIAAPAAEGYYRKIGMRPIKSGWLIPRDG